MSKVVWETSCKRVIWKLIYLTHYSDEVKNATWLGNIYITRWLSNISDLVLVLSFGFRMIKCGRFFMLGFIASNFQKIGNGWTIIVKYATTAVYVGTHFFPQFLENSRSHSNAFKDLISSKKHAPIKWESDWCFCWKYVWYYWWPSELG